MKRDEVKAHASNVIRSSYSDLWDLIHKLTISEDEMHIYEVIKDKLHHLDYQRYNILNHIEICEVDCTYCNSTATHEMSSTATDMKLIPICKNCTPQAPKPPEVTNG